MKSVVKNDRIPHQPKNNVISVICQNDRSMHDRQRLPATVREKRITTTPTFWENETERVGAVAPQTWQYMRLASSFPAPEGAQFPPSLPPASVTTAVP